VLLFFRLREAKQYEKEKSLNIVTLRSPTDWRAAREHEQSTRSQGIYIHFKAYN
jgi:hypothetical protein